LAGGGIDRFVKRTLQANESDKLLIKAFMGMAEAEDSLVLIKALKPLNNLNAC